MTAASDATANVALLALGGTIATADAEDGMQPRLTADQLTRALGDAGGFARITASSLRQAPSSDLTFADLAEVAHRARDAIEQGADGVVVTQGTDTLEESAFVLDLLLDLPRPVVMTGAMRNPALPGADGAANLLAALRVAASPAAAGLGVLAVMNDEVHAARFVRKGHTHKPSAFASPAAGPLGWVVEDRVRIVTRPAQPSPTIAWREAPPPVPVVTLGLSTGPEVLDGFMERLPAGLIVETLGAGHAPSAMVERLGAIAAKRPVVLASRIGVGELYRATYGYDGSEIDLLRRGCLTAGWLDPAKARILLALLLADGADRARVAQVFADF